MTTKSQYHESNKTSNSEQVSLKEVLLETRKCFHYLISKWVTIVFFVLLGITLGYIYSRYKKTTYTSSTTFVLEEEKSSGGLGSIAGLASMAGLDLGSNGGGIFQGDNILELYKSRSMIQRTLLTEVLYNGQKELLIDHYLNLNNLKEEWKDNPELKSIKFLVAQGHPANSDLNLTRLQDSVLGVVTEKINKSYLSVAKLDKKLSIIKADVTASDEFFAKVFNEQIVKNVNDFYIQTKTKKSSDNVAILQQKVDSVRAVMNGAIYTASAASDATPNLNPTRQVQRNVPVQRSQFSAETNKMVLGELVKNLELSKISLRKETPLIQVIDNPIFPLQKNKLSPIKGIVTGGILFGFIITLILIGKYIVAGILRDETN